MPATFTVPERHQQLLLAGPPGIDVSKDDLSTG
jgi:hypothetical protein